MKEFWEKYGSYVPALLFILGGILVFFVFRIPCLSQLLFGMSCPGCGLTRAFLAVLSGDIALSFKMHPFWIALIPCTVAAFILHVKKKDTAFYIVVASSVAVYIGIWVVRLILKDPVVEFNIESGIIYRAFVWVWMQVSNFLNI